MIYKDAAISANVGTSSSSRTTNIHFSTQDIGTAKLTFKVFKDGVPLPLSAVTGKLVLVMADGSKFIKNITIVDKLNGIAEYVLTSEEIKHYGKVQASLNLYYDNKQSMGITQFTFQIDKDLIDSDIVPIAEYYIEDFETLRQSVEAIVADLQEKFKDLDNVETKAGAQKKADAVQANLDTHTRNKANPHGVTKSQIGLGNVDNVQQASKQDFDLHVSDATKHISTAERSNWNAKETTAGAKNKADTAEKNAKTYADQHINDKSNPHGVTKDQVGLGNVINDKQATKAEFDTHVKDATAHISAAERTKWNGAQLSKITNDVGGVLVSIADTDDFLDKIVKAGKTFGTFYSTGKPSNAPSTISTRGYFHFTATDANGNGIFGYVIAIDYKNNMYTNIVDGNLGWSGWKRLSTDVDFEKITWQNVTLKNGAANGDRPFQYAKWGKLLLLRGQIKAPREVMIGSIPASMVPSNGAVVLASTIGITGVCKLIVFGSGDLKLTGLMSNDNNAVTGYYMDVNPIPLD
ncbi:phage baseplate upper protein [Bacillus subtilis]|uniref:phage baseplate upper protein n=1 Tax=Bacillus subtilis TaxID=1423 RepID=UPI00240E5C44|nr:phage baseplate upper protein [Bacillus subtilis]WEZ19208.1 phage baseplate upper protein [Bacillus subtilis]